MQNCHSFLEQYLFLNLKNTKILSTALKGSAGGLQKIEVLERLVSLSCYLDVLSFATIKSSEFAVQTL